MDSSEKDQPGCLQEIMVFALAPTIVALLTLAAWSAGRWLSVPEFVPAALAILATLFGGWQRFLAGFRDALDRKITVNLFVTVAIGITIGAGEFLPAAVIILIMAIVGSLESYTLDNTRRSIRGLLDLAPPQATVKRDNTEAVVPVAELQIGDVVVVRPGERIPVDGMVTAGTSTVNQAPITGESMPVDKCRGSDVFGGTLNISGRLEIRTDKIGADTILAKIVHLVETAQEVKAPIQTIADRFTVWFLPTVLLLALIGYFATGDLKVAIAILLVACPCAFAIATPSAVAAGIANMARRAVLIKGGIYFEIAGKVDTLVVDKTGTLTLGQPKVMEVLNAAGTTADETIRLAAIAEKYSEHPLAKAVMALAAERRLEIPDPDEFRIEVGMGVAATCGGMNIVVGRNDFLKKQGIGLPEPVEQEIITQTELGRTVVLVAQDDNIKGIISIADAVKPETLQAIEALKGLGLHNIVMLTGDNSKVAQAVAQQIGVNEYHAEQLPEDKQRVIKDLQNQGRIVCMVGDGINDAPTLALADVGIAMGAAGTHVSIEASDVTLMNDDLFRLVEFVQMSRKVLKRIKLNIFFSIIYNAIGLTLAMLGHLSPVMAVIFQEAGCVTVVLSSTLLLWAKTPQHSGIPTE